MNAYDDIRNERKTHAARGYGGQHDQEHGADHLVSWAMFYASKGDRQSIVKSASLLVAAIELLDQGADA